MKSLQRCTQPVYPFCRMPINFPSDKDLGNSTITVTFVILVCLVILILLCFFRVYQIRRLFPGNYPPLIPPAPPSGGGILSYESSSAQAMKAKIDILEIVPLIGPPRNNRNDPEKIVRVVEIDSKDIPSTNKGYGSVV